MKSKLQAFKLTQELLKNKEEMLKYPDTFRNILADLRKAVIDDVPDDDEPQEEDYGDEGSLMDDDSGNMSSDEEDDADKFLKEKASKKDEAPEEGKKKHMRDWEPQSEYSDEHRAAIEKHMANGYSHREAERMSGAHKGPSDLRSAMRSGIAPSMMSDKMMSEMKPLAKLYLEEADKREKLSANPEVNPMKHASGKLMEAHEKSTANYSKAYNEFLGSDALKDLKGKDRHQAIQSWKSEWKQSNPDHESGMQQASSAQKVFGEAKEVASQSLKDKLDHIRSGGQSTPAEMSTAEAMQHLGGGKTEEGYQGTIKQDPSASFAARNPELVAALKPEQQERLQRVDSAAKAQGKVRIRKAGVK